MHLYTISWKPKTFQIKDQRVKILNFKTRKHGSQTQNFDGNVQIREKRVEIYVNFFVLFKLTLRLKTGQLVSWYQRILNSRTRQDESKLIFGVFVTPSPPLSRLQTRVHATDPPPEKVLFEIKTFYWKKDALFAKFLI